MSHCIIKHPPPPLQPTPSQHQRLFYDCLLDKALVFTLLDKLCLPLRSTTFSPDVTVTSESVMF